MGPQHESLQTTAWLWTQDHTVSQAHISLARLARCSAKSTVSTAVLTVPALGLGSHLSRGGEVVGYPLSPTPGRLAGLCHLLGHIRVWLITQFAQQSFRADIFVFYNSILYLQKLHY